MPEAPLNPTEFTSAVTALTGAFGDPTRRKIFLFAQQATDGVTASDVAAEFDLHANVARHHLDKLLAGGYLEVAIERPAPRRAGRPSKRYRGRAVNVTPEIPVRRDEVLVTLLNRALALLPTDEAEAMAVEVGESYGRALAHSMVDPNEGQRSFRSALHAVADALTAHGFAAHIDTAGSALRIVTEHCPFGGADAVHPVLCAVDRGMVSGMLDELYGKTEAGLQASLPMGDDHCAREIAG